ncbi:MAG: helix-turn-helix domain-containing protein [Bacteroidales bacterium]
MASDDLRLLVIGPGPRLPDATVQALEAFGIRLAGEVARVEHLPDGDGVDVLLLHDEQPVRAVIEVRAEDGLLPVVVRSFDTGLSSALRDSGAPGWAIVSPDSTPDELAAAIVAAARGFAVRPASSPRRVVATTRRNAADGLDRLTEREGEVLALVSEGLPNKGIAARLGISEHTVKFHLSSIFSKLGVSSRTEAVRRGVRSGLIEL